MTNCLLKNNSPYEKSNHTWFYVFSRCLDAGFLLQRTRSDHDDNASDYRHNGATAAHVANNNNNDAPDGRRLLIADSP